MAPSVTTVANQYFPLSIKTLAPVDRGCIAIPSPYGTKHAKQLVAKAFRSRLDAIDTNSCEAGEDDAFFVADMGEVYRQHLRWKAHLSRIMPHYAVKCNSDPQVLRLLAALGTGFDCASKSEIEQVLQMGVDPSRIIYAQPCKTNSYVRYAAQQNVRQMTFDNADELYKTKKFFPDAELYLRILTDDSASLCRLSLKFGAPLDTTYELLELAKTLGLNVVGVAFHIGSGASDAQAFSRAVQDARVVFDQAEAIGFSMHTLDVGGGFCTETFEDMASVLSEALDTHFAPHIRIISEPGRYYVSTAFSIACNVIARRTDRGERPDHATCKVYLNDGVYGNFSSILFDHQHPVPRILSLGDRFVYGQEPCDSGVDGRRLTHYSVWGPTCDGIDCIAEKALFAADINVGDWLYFEQMGAYTKCSATRFNGFTDRHQTIYVSSEAHATALLGV